MQITGDAVCSVCCPNEADRKDHDNYCQQDQAQAVTIIVHQLLGLVKSRGCLGKNAVSLLVQLRAVFIKVTDNLLLNRGHMGNQNQLAKAAKRIEVVDSGVVDHFQVKTQRGVRSIKRLVKSCQQLG